MNIERFKKWTAAIKSPGAFIVVLVLLAAGCGGGGGGTAGFNADFHLIIPQTAAVSAAADIDGVTPGDAKWNDAFDIQLVDGVPIDDNYFWGVADASYLYVYFETAVEDFNELDAIAIALSPTADPTEKHLLVIYPCVNTAACTGTNGGITTDIDYYTDPDGDNTYNSAGAGHNVLAEAYVSESGGEGVWAIEVRIPRGAPYNLPATGFFGLYAAVLDYDQFTSSVYQYTWPFNNVGGTTELAGTIAPGSTNAIPLQAEWGNVSLDASLPTGVSISTQDISTNHGSSQISINQPNTFYADVHNYDTTVAQGIQAEFQLANFGLPAYGSWETIGNSAAADINPTDSEVYTLNWSVPPDRVADYTDHDHQCIRVELTSSNPLTSFITTSAQRNMDFVVTASPFKSVPAIATKGYKLAEGLRREQFIVKEKFYNFDPKLKWESRIEGAKKIANNKYKVEIATQKSKDLNLAVLAPEKALVPFEKHIVPKITNGKESDIIKVPVGPGKLVTLVPNTTVPDTTFNPTREMALNVKATANKKSASGMLYGSWDEFRKTSFVVEAGASLVAPKGAKALYLKQTVVNNKEDNRIVNAQKLNIYVTGVSQFPDYLSSVNIHRPGNSGSIGFGANLPTAAYFGYRNSGKKLTVKDKRFDVYSTAGSFGYVVKGREKDQ